MADFDSWSRESLVRFAQDASTRMGEQKVEIEALQIRIGVMQVDLHAALAAYRREVTSSRPSPSRTS